MNTCQAYILFCLFRHDLRSVVVVYTVEPPLTATSLQRSPFCNGHLPTTATFFCTGDGPNSHSHFNRYTAATSPQRQRPPKRVPNYQNNLSTLAS